MEKETGSNQEAVRHILDMVKEGRLEPGEAETLIAGLMERARQQERRSSARPLGDLLKAIEQMAGEAARWGKAVASEIADHLQEATRSEEEAPTVAFDEQGSLVHEEPAEGLQAVEVTNVNGPIEVIGSATETVRLVANCGGRWGDASGQNGRKKGFGVDIQREGGTLVVRTRMPTHYHLAHGDEYSVSYRIELPARLRVKARTVNGEVRATGLQADTNLRTVNGSLDLTAGEQWEGSLSAKTVNGSITLQLPGLPANANLKTVNGEIAVTLTGKLVGELNAKTLHGGLTLHVPAGAAFSLSAKTGMSGSIQTDWGDGKRSFEAPVHGGGAPVMLRALSGDIRVRQIGQQTPGSAPHEASKPVADEPPADGPSRFIEL